MPAQIVPAPTFKGGTLVENQHFKRAAAQLEKDARGARRQEKYDAERTAIEELLTSVQNSESAQREMLQHRVRRKQDRQSRLVAKQQRDELQRAPKGVSSLVYDEPVEAAARLRAEAVALRKFQEQQVVDEQAARAAAAATRAALEARIVEADNAAAAGAVDLRGELQELQKVQLRREWARQAAFAERQRCVGRGVGKKQLPAGEWAAVP